VSHTEQPTVQDIVESVQQLAQIAREQPNSDDGRDAAVRALQLMREHDLAIVPAADLERARTACAQQLVATRRQADARALAYAIGAFCLARRM
jgi:hypothetical protein